ncbi:MAG: Rab family GTPase [Promethearchaeota archaeon]
MLYKFKLIVVGDAAVGKTSLIRHFCEGFFKDTYRSTIGVSFLKKELSLGEDDVVLQVWDVGGQDLFQAVRPTYYRGAHGALILFDVTNAQTLSHVYTWHLDLTKTLPDLPILMVGNKIDLPYDEEKVRTQTKTMAEKLGLEYYFTSAKEGTNMNEIFTVVATRMKDHVNEEVD